MRREEEMPRSFAVNNTRFSMAAKVVLTLLMALTLSTILQAQGPALTTISGHRVSGRWNCRIGYGADFVAVVPDRSGRRGGSGQSECDDRAARRVYRSTGGQCRRFSGGNLLRCGFTTGRWKRADGILGSSGGIADDDCGGADNAGHGAWEPRSDAAIRERGGGTSCGRRDRGAPGGNGDDYRHKAVYCASVASCAGRSQ